MIPSQPSHQSSPLWHHPVLLFFAAATLLIVTSASWYLSLGLLLHDSVTKETAKPHVPTTSPAAVGQEYRATLTAFVATLTEDLTCAEAIEKSQQTLSVIRVPKELLAVHMAVFLSLGQVSPDNDAAMCRATLVDKITSLTI